MYIMYNCFVLLYNRQFKHYILETFIGSEKRVQYRRPIGLKPTPVSCDIEEYTIEIII